MQFSRGIVNQVLFLCSGNYYRSRYAEELFNSRSVAKSGGWRAESRGLNMNPDNSGPIASIVLRRLSTQGVTPINADRMPQAARAVDLDGSALVIAMSRGEHYPLLQVMFPAYAERITYWDVEDTGGMPLNIAFSRIEYLVDRLIEDIDSQEASNR